LVRARPVVYCPFELGGVGTLVNLSLAALPCVRWLGFATVLIMRPLKAEALSRRPSLSVVIPARNEKGNIENAVSRLQAFPADLEIIFVEGHSNDSTWEEIQRVIETYSGPHRLKALRQTGKGKNDAVRLGLSQANGELLAILDADLTMPPELISRFYEAYCLGLADFVNGTRLVYPMEGQAMRFLNLLGNIAFAKALSFVLDIAIGDSLCGTKLLARHDYERAVRWRKDFGDFDPFGDFELIFPAAMLGLGIIDIPIRYQARTYGTTQIHRFRHGLMLLKMTLIGLVKIRMGSR
jgi:glycosyltransferase involved in cell wall biosynthesis